jgi:hypothetical protein
MFRVLRLLTFVALPAFGLQILLASALHTETVPKAVDGPNASATAQVWSSSNKISDEEATTGGSDAWIRDNVLDSELAVRPTSQSPGLSSCAAGSRVRGYCQVTEKNGQWVETGDCIANCNTQCVYAAVSPCVYGQPVSPNSGTNFCQAGLYVSFATSCAFVYQ